MWQDTHICATWHTHTCNRTHTWDSKSISLFSTHSFFVQTVCAFFISRGKNQGIKPPTEKVSDLSKTTHFDKLPTFFRNVTLYPGVFAKVAHLKACDSLRMCLLMRHTHICVTRCTHTYDSTRTYVRYDTHTHTCDRTHTYTWQYPRRVAWPLSFFCSECDTKHAHARHDTHICARWCTCICVMTHTYVWQYLTRMAKALSFSSLSVTRHPRTCDRTNTYVQHDTRATWHICDMTHTYAWQHGTYVRWHTHTRDSTLEE